MIDPLKFYEQLDELDPRINPLPATLVDDLAVKILKRNLHSAECLKAVLVDDPGNVLAFKAVGVINAIQSQRRFLQEGGGPLFSGGSHEEVLEPRDVDPRNGGEQ
jgi:hypothetical protein